MLFAELQHVVGCRDPSDLVGKLSGVPAGEPLSAEFSERGTQVGRGEGGGQDAPQEPRVLVVQAELGNFLLEMAAVVRNGPAAPAVQEPARRVQVNTGSDRAGPELDA